MSSAVASVKYCIRVPRQLGANTRPPGHHVKKFETPCGSQRDWTSPRRIRSACPCSLRPSLTRANTRRFFRSPARSPVRWRAASAIWEPEKGSTSTEAGKGRAGHAVRGSEGPRLTTFGAQPRPDHAIESVTSAANRPKRCIRCPFSPPPAALSLLWAASTGKARRKERRACWCTSWRCWFRRRSSARSGGRIERQAIADLGPV
jgi:hypothetical protein